MEGNSPGPTAPGPVTEILDELRRGQPGAEEQLFGLVYGELRRLAGGYMREQPGGHTLQPTALVNEAYMRLMGNGTAEWNDRAHFLGCAARAMRSILVDFARAKAAQKRGGDNRRFTLDERFDGATHDPLQVVAIHDALDRLKETAPEAAQVVELRFFGGLTLDEISDVLDVSKRSVCRLWEYARLWLYREVAP
jgi:RNA polymerase sigma factor (TIGR02999 family)